MEYKYLSENVRIVRVSEDEKKGVFEVEGLYRGYGLTIGNAVRRVLLSSIPGAAITRFRVKGVGHEFSTVPGVMEDVVEIGLNLKQVRFKFYADEPQVLLLKAKGEKSITAADIEGNAQVIVQNPEQHIATLTAKNAEIEIELTVEKGLAYVPVEAQKIGRLPIGAVALDAVFSPVKNVNFEVENMRVGERTDYNKVRFEIETDGTLSPSGAIHKAANILVDHFQKVSAIDVAGATSGESAEVSDAEGESVKKPSAKKAKK